MEDLDNLFNLMRNRNRVMGKKLCHLSPIQTLGRQEIESRTKILEKEANRLELAKQELELFVNKWWQSIREENDLTDSSLHYNEEDNAVYEWIDKDEAERRERGTR